MTADPQPALVAVQADASTPETGVEVPLVTENGEITLTVPPVGRWRARAVRAMRQGDYVEWAEAVLSEDDAAAFKDADPFLDEIGEFFAEWQRRSGESRGKSSRSTKS